MLERLKLTLNDKETSLRDACREHFDFLGYTFGPHYSMRTGREYIGKSPSKKSVAKIKENVGDLLVPSNVAPWDEVCEKLNQKLRGPLEPYHAQGAEHSFLWELAGTLRRYLVTPSQKVPHAPMGA